jgi:Succinate dehydrogenase/fumarate reductase, flavoprotein subunit
VEKLEELKEKAKKVRATGSKAFNPGWHLCRDMRNMFICSEAIARSALSRKESRGAHSRLDYPNTEADWGTKNTAIEKGEGDKMKLTHTPLPQMPEDLKELFVKKKEPSHA